MKKSNIILIICLLMCWGCGNGGSSETHQENTVAKQEEILAEEAEENSIQAKEEANSAEKEVNELLEDI